MHKETKGIFLRKTKYHPHQSFFWCGIPQKYITQIDIIILTSNRSSPHFKTCKNDLCFWFGILVFFLFYFCNRKFGWFFFLVLASFVFFSFAYRKYKILSLKIIYNGIIKRRIRNRRRARRLCVCVSEPSMLSQQCSIHITQCIRSSNLKRQIRKPVDHLLICVVLNKVCIECFWLILFAMFERGLCYFHLCCNRFGVSFIIFAGDCWFFYSRYSLYG